MVDFEELLRRDYDLSFKIARILHRDGIPRKLFQFATLTGTAVVWFLGLLAAYFIAPDWRQEAFNMLVVTLVMVVPVFIIKQSTKRPRPAFKDTRYGAVVFDHWSFPSGHATRAVYVMMLMPIYTPSLAMFWYIWGTTMILSRLLLGVHYVTDIIAGVILSFTCITIGFLMGWLPHVPFYQYL